jgi:hypothetical protein
MILPGKHIRQDRALISIGGDILSVLKDQSTVSDIWDKVRAIRGMRDNASPLPFDWFVLALCLLYAMSVIELDGDKLKRSRMTT